MMLELFECERLAARISAVACVSNRARGVFACDGCPGLGARTVVGVAKEAEVMGRRAVSGLKKGDRFVCPECGKERAYESKGVCAVCNRRRREGEVKVVDVVPDVQPVDASGSVVEALQPGFGMVRNGDGDLAPFGVDAVILQALDDVWMQKRGEWLVELSGVKPAAAVCRTASMVKAVEMLGY